jgi:hypothetical protein
VALLSQKGSVEFENKVKVKVKVQAERKCKHTETCSLVYCYREPYSKG